MKIVMLLFLGALSVLSLDLPFTDEFEDNNYDGWVILDESPAKDGPSVWAVEGGILKQKSNIYTNEKEYERFTGTQITTGDTSWKDYSFNIEVLSGDNDGIGVLFRVRDSKNYYRYVCVEDRGNKGPFRRLDKCVNGVFHTIAENKDAFTYDQLFYCIGVVVFGDSIKIYETHNFGGGLIVQGRDAEFSSGKIGMMCYANPNAQFDNVLVTSEMVFDTTAKFNLIVNPYLQNLQPNSITVMWETLTKRNSRLFYGKTLSFTDSASAEPATIHEVTIAGLEPATKYYYGIEVGDSIVKGEDYYFKTAPKTNSQVPYEFLVWGDNRTDPKSHQAVTDAMSKEKACFAINVGDVVTNGNNYREWKKEFFDPASTLLKNTPVFVAIGNHENNSSWFYSYYSQPKPENYFMTSYGKAALLFIDSNQPYGPGTGQYKWIVNALDSASKTSDWIFAFFHHPPYSQQWDSYDFIKGPYTGTADVRNHLVPLLEKYKVDIVFNGHTHDYERGLKNGVYYIISGGGGNSLDRVKTASWDHINTWQSKFHYCKVSVDFDKLNLKMITPSGQVADEFNIKKNIDPVGISEENTNENIRFNIFSHQKSIYNIQVFSRTKKMSVNIYDAAGKIVARLNTNNINQAVWNSSGMAKGVYFVNVISGKNSYLEKMILVH